MTEKIIPDGNTRHEPVVNVMNCFFCMLDKANCGAYSVNLREDCDPLLEPYRGQRFAMCQECQAKADKDPGYPAHVIVQYVMAENLIQKGSRRKRGRR